MENPLAYVPADLGHLGENYRYMLRSAVKYGDIKSLRAFGDWWSYPLTAVMTCRGCSRDCTFCGGSAWSMRRCFARERPAFRAPSEIAHDVETISRFTGAPVFVIGDLRQNGDDYAREALDGLARVHPGNHVVLELFEPAPRWFFESASRLPNFDLEISPESHDEEIRRAAGKRYYQPGARADDRTRPRGGLRQGRRLLHDRPASAGPPVSVMETVAYCSRLLGRFGPRVNPLIGPLAPFLDPGSIAHDKAGSNGYRLLYHSLDDYRTALLNPHWRDMLSYETEWMSRQDIVDATYSAMLELNRVKREGGRTPPDLADLVDRFIRDSMDLLDRLDRTSAECDQAAVERELIAHRRRGALPSRQKRTRERGAQVARRGQEVPLRQHPPFNTGRKMSAFRRATSALKGHPKRIAAVVMGVLATGALALALVNIVYARVNHFSLFSGDAGGKLRIEISQEAKQDLGHLIDGYLESHPELKISIRREEP